MNTQRKKIIATFMIGLLIGAGVGYGYGFEQGARKSMEWGLRVAKNFMNIEFDEKEIAGMIYFYENKINGCYNSTELNNG